MLCEAGRRTAAVGVTHHSLNGLSSDPISASLIADDVSPAARSRRRAVTVATVRDRPGAANDDDAGQARRTGFERDQRVVHHEHARAGADAAHDGADDPGVLVAIDAGNAEADRPRPGVMTSVERGVHHVMQHLLDGELSGNLEIGSWS